MDAPKPKRHRRVPTDPHLLSVAVELATINTLKRRRPFQFSLRAFMLVCAIVFGCLGGKLQKRQAEDAQRQAFERNERTEEDLRLAGLSAHWSGKLFHPEFSVSSTGEVTDVDLKCLKGLINLKRLDLCNIQVTDEGVEKLQKALPNCTISHCPPTMNTSPNNAIVAGIANEQDHRSACALGPLLLWDPIGNSV